MPLHPRELITVYDPYLSLVQIYPSLAGNFQPVRHATTIVTPFAGELDTLISSLPHAHLITSPVFGTPAVAEKSQLLIIMSGDYRSKKEVAYLLVPAVGRKVVDLGGNLEKGKDHLPRNCF